MTGRIGAKPRCPIRRSLTGRERAINAEESATRMCSVGAGNTRIHEGRATYAVFTSAERPQAW
jgi:hypothetical protein